MDHFMDMDLKEFDAAKLMEQMIGACESVRVITDARVVMDRSEGRAKGMCPPGYTLIDADLNKGSGGHYIYLCVKYDEILTFRKR